MNNSNDKYFYAPDSFNRDSITACYCSADSAISVNADDLCSYTSASISTPEIKGLKGSIGPDYSTLADITACVNSIGTVTDSFDALSARVDALECNLNSWNSIGSVNWKAPWTFNRSAYKTLKKGRELDSRSREI